MRSVLLTMTSYYKVTMTSFWVQRGEGFKKGRKIAVILKVCPLAVFILTAIFDISCDVTAITKTISEERTYLLVCPNVAYRCRTNAHPFFVGFSFETFTDIYWRVTVPK